MPFGIYLPFPPNNLALLTFNLPLKPINLSVLPLKPINLPVSPSGYNFATFNDVG